jgi:hypothetical protein
MIQSGELESLSGVEDFAALPQHSAVSLWLTGGLRD